MKKKVLIYILFIFPLFILIFNSFIFPVQATETIYLNNVNNDFAIDGYTYIWFNTSTDQRDISVRFDSSVHRIITGVRIHYRTARLLADYDDCPTTYKFESGVDWVDYNDNFPNSSGNDQIHEFHCQGDTFLITNTFFYISMGCGSDDPYIQVGVDTDRSGHSEYSLNGGSWTLDIVEYLVEALVENITDLTENEEISGEITINDDFVDAYNLSLTINDDVHFNLKSNDQNENLNMRFFPGNTKLTSDGNAIWLEEGTISQKTHHYIPTSSQDYLLLIEPNTDGVDNASYTVNWTYAPDPPVVDVLPGTNNDGNVSLSWSAPVDTDLDYYNVYRSNSPNVPIDVAHRITTPGTLITTEFDDNYLANGTHYYVVTSVDNTGHESIASNEVFTTIGDVIKPKAPDLETPDLYPIDNDGNILINWTFKNLDDVISCNIYRSNQPEFRLNTSTLLTNILKSSTTFEDQVILNGIYYYKVTSLDINGLESNASNEVNTTYIDITPPSIPKDIKYEIVNNKDISLSWDTSDDIDFSYYKIYRSDQLISNKDLEELKPIHTTSNNYWIDEDLSSGEYYYVIVAVDLNGLKSEISNNLSIKLSRVNNISIFLIFLIPTIIGMVLGALIVIHRQKHGYWFWKDENIKNKISNFKGKLSTTIVNFKERISNRKKAIKTKSKKIKISIGQTIIPESDDFEVELTKEELELLKNVQISEKIEDSKFKEIWEKSSDKKLNDKN